MKSFFLLLLAVGVFSLAGCESREEDAREDAAEARAEALEEKAEAVEKQAD